MKARIYSLEEKKYMKRCPMQVRFCKRLKVSIFRSPKYNVTVESALLEKSKFVVQYSSGKKDLFGKEIYEGDIVEIDCTLRDMADFEVIFLDGAFQLKPLKMPKDMQFLGFCGGKYFDGYDAHGNATWKQERPGPQPICDFGRLVVTGKVLK